MERSQVLLLRGIRSSHRFAGRAAWAGGLSALTISAVWAASTAWAAEAPATTSSGASEVVFIAQIVLLLVVGRLLGEAMQRIGQPAVIGQLIAGILLGPSLFGAVWPEAQHAIFPSKGEQKSMIDAVSQLGILMLLLLTGMETDLGLVKKIRVAAASVSICGIAIPFLCGFTLGEFLPDSMLPNPDQRLITSLFLGTALSISSVKIVAMVVREMNFMRRNVGQVIVASAIIDDTIGWIIIAITFGLAAHGAVDLATLARSVLGTLLFLVVSLTFGRRIVFSVIRWTNDNFISDVPVVTAIIVIMGVMALTTHFIGVHTVLGAFVAGILVGESPILSRHVDAQLRGLITALFAPVFFGLAGLSTDLSIFQNASLVWLLVAVVAIASLGKFGGAFIGGRIGGLNFSESLALACGMNARGSTEVIVATIGLSLGMLNQDLFTVIVAMAVITTTAMPPTLRWALARLPLGEEEKKRLEREEFEAKGFISNMERLLIAADDTANGKFAARLAGSIAGLNGMPTTIIATHSKGSALTSERAIHAAAQTAKVAETRKESIAPAKVDVSTRPQGGPADEAVASEARKGYDLLVVGIGDAVKHGEFSEELNRIAAQFEGPLAIVVARGVHLERPLRSPLHILVPVTGTEVSRQAAEVGIAIAHATGSPITALYIPTGKVTTGAHGLRTALQSQRQHEAILKDVVEMADRSSIEIRTAVKVNAQPEEAILKRASAKRHTLIVMGVNRRPGEALFFGNTVAAVVERSQRSILLISSPGSIATSVTGGTSAQKPGTS